MVGRDFAAAVTAMISVTKTPFSSLIVAFAVFMALWIIRQLLPDAGLARSTDCLSCNAVNAHEVISRLLMFNHFYNQPLAPALCIAFATIIVLLISSAITYKALEITAVAKYRIAIIKD
ncbi:MAG: hypothetical protein ACLRXC_09285 [[Clostridium] leptum]